MHDDGPFVNSERRSRKSQKQIPGGISEFQILTPQHGETRKSDQNAKISNGFTNCGHQRDDQLMIPN